MNILDIGTPFIEFTAVDLDGKEHPSKDLKGTPFLIEFWSLNCMICMSTAPELRAAYEKYGDKVQFVSFNCDMNQSAWEAGTRRDQIKWLNLSDLQGMNGVAGQYGVVAYPLFYLIDGNGIVIDRWMGNKKGRIEEKLQKVL